MRSTSKGGPDGDNPSVAAALQNLVERVGRLARKIDQLATQLGGLMQDMSLQRAVAECAPKLFAGAQAPKLTTPKELPLLMGVKEVYRLIGLSPKELREFVEWGYVRTRKRGDNRQGKRTFLTEDILAALYDEANGRVPRKKRKTP